MAQGQKENAFNGKLINDAHKVTVEVEGPVALPEDVPGWAETGSPARPKTGDIKHVGGGN